MKRPEVPRDDDWEFPSTTVLAWVEWALVWGHSPDLIIPPLHLKLDGYDDDLP